MKTFLAHGLAVFLGLHTLASAADAPAVRWKPVADMDGQLFPSLIIATATRRPGADDAPKPDLLGDHYGLLGISIRSPGAKTSVKVTVRENEVLNTSIWTGTLAAGGHTYFIAPRIAYKFDALRRVRQQTPLSVLFDVEVNGQSAGTQSETVNLRSLNDCPYAVDDDEETLSEDDTKSKSPAGGDNARSSGGLHGDSGTALGWMFAAYINEDHPIIEVLLKEALHTGIITNVDGYQDGKPAEVLRQAFAVWTVLQSRGVRYSDVSTNPGGSDKVSSQYVRFVDESLRHEQANCVDGSVLFASVLRKMGLAPFLVIVPGHMYMGVELSDSEDDDSVACIETTMLGAGEPDTTIRTVKEIQGLEKSLDSAARGNAAWKTFRAAVSFATAAYRRDKSKFEDEDNADYQVIDVAAARADGIMPIPFDRPQRPPELPGGPTHAQPALGGEPARPLPTPFVKPPSSPAPKSTPKSAPPAPEMTPADTPKPTPRATPKPSPGGTGGGNIWMNDASDAPATPRARRSPTPRPSPSASAGGFFD